MQQVNAVYFGLGPTLKKYQFGLKNDDKISSWPCLEKKTSQKN